MISPSGCLERARYEGDSRAIFLIVDGRGADAERLCMLPFPLAEFDSFGCSVESGPKRAIGGGLQMSNIGSSDSARACLVCVGAVIAAVTIAD